MPRIPFEEGALGVISDLHNNLETLDKAIFFYKENPVDAIILNGDTPGYTIRSFVNIINKLLKLNIHIVIFPGSHENGEIYEKTMSKFIGNKLLINSATINNRVIFYGDWELVMIPGSGVISTGPRKFVGGSYWLFEKKLTTSRKIMIDKRIKEVGMARKSTPIILEDSENLMKRKSKSSGSKKIVFAHDPILCKTSKGIDLAKFGIPKKEFQIKKKHLRLKAFKKSIESKNIILNTHNILPMNEVELLRKYDYPIKVQKKHVGTQFINNFLKRNRITKFVCGHIHECGMTAIDKNENRIKSNTLTSQLYLNSGPNTTTRLEFNKNKVKYSFMS